MSAVIDMEQRDGHWTWTYREDPGDFELQSNKPFGSEDEALQAAHLAYPGVPVREHSLESSSREAPAGRSRTKELTRLVLAAVAIAWILRRRLNAE